MSAILRINDEKPRLCVQCKHYRTSEDYEPSCAASVDIVTGERRTCADMRGVKHRDYSDGQPILCGLKGDLWEAE